MNADSGPIFSKLGSAPEVATIVEGFVEDLASRVDELQDQEALGNFDELSRQAADLSVDAIKSGFDLFSDCASGIADAARDHEGERVHKRLIDLTEMSWRIRLGHRGAA